MAFFRKPARAELQRAHLAGAAAPRVIAVTYDGVRDRVSLEFDRGFAVAISPRLYPGFENAIASDLSEIEILGSGDAVHFTRINQSLLVANLLAELTGPPSPSLARATTARKELPMRVQGGYLGGSNGEMPTPPKGGSSFRPPKARCHGASS